MTEEVYERARTLMEAELGDELVALDDDVGECFGFNAVAASVWRLLDQPRSEIAIRRALLDEYDVDPDRCTQELSELLDDLVARGLVRRALAPCA